MLDRHVFFSMDLGENAVEDLKCFRRIDLAKQRNLGTASGGGAVFLVVHCGAMIICAMFAHAIYPMKENETWKI